VYQNEYKFPRSFEEVAETYEFWADWTTFDNPINREDVKGYACAKERSARRRKEFLDMVMSSEISQLWLRLSHISPPLLLNRPHC
jgi:hypothetical protein